MEKLRDFHSRIPMPRAFSFGIVDTGIRQQSRGGAEARRPSALQREQPVVALIAIANHLLVR